MQCTEKDNKRMQTTLQSYSLPLCSSIPALSLWLITQCFSPVSTRVEWESSSHGQELQNYQGSANSGEHKRYAGLPPATFVVHLQRGAQTKHLLEVRAAANSRRDVKCGPSRTEASLHPLDWRNQLYKGAAISDTLLC